MANNDNILRVLQRNGTDQLDRDATSLAPGSVKLHGFGLEDWMQFAWSFAEKVKYFSVEDDQNAVGNWQKMFLAKDGELEAFIRQIEEKDGNVTPHLTLFACFLKLMELSSARLNGITKRHLDFYYRDVLRISEIPAREDKAHILFELAKNVAEYEIRKGTELDGGKDKSGKKRIYAIAEELNATRTTVAQLKNVYNEHNITDDAELHDEKRYWIKAAPVANSSDGIGGELKAEDPAWYPFGYYTHTKTLSADQLQEELPGLPEVPDAKLGFAVASPVLMLSEGHRKVTVKLSFTGSLAGGITPKDIKESFEVWFTGAKKWLGPFTVSESIQSSADQLVKQSRMAGEELSLVTELTIDELKVVGYNPLIHGEQFATTFPVARFLLKTDTAAGYGIYAALAGQNNLRVVTVSVDVTGMKNLVLDSDTGTLNPGKPFYPFTTNPVRGAAFGIYNEEVFSKHWTDLSVKMQWKNTPLSFPSHYMGYDKTFASTVGVEKYGQLYGNFDFKTVDAAFLATSIQYNQFNRAEMIQAMNQEKKAKAKKGMEEESSLQEKTNSSPQETTTTTKPDIDPIVTSNEYFKAEAQVLHKEVWEDRGPVSLFAKISKDGVFSTSFGINGEKLERGKTGPVRLVLQQSFLHYMFPRLYAVAISSKVPNTLIPNEPYTPFAENVTLDYSASDTVVVQLATRNTKKSVLLRKSDESILDKRAQLVQETVSVETALSNEEPFDERRVQLFHEHPFGQSEEHGKLKQLYGESSTECHVLPTYCKGGELYIGLQGAQVSEMISLLVQVVEGTENPLAKTFEGGQKVSWDILGNNVWHPLDSLLMVTNETDNFLLSGRVRFTVPPSATNDNTLLPSGLVWVRAKMTKRYDAVSKVIGIHAQAGLAGFVNHDNDLSHLATGLPDKTISRLVQRLSQVKGVVQPYPTFGGRPEESDALYYRRISERLRHKNRAVALWDYEHIVLQEFPEVYKVKCLNHTCKKHFTTPGSVSLVVIPDTVSRNVFDIYQPRVSTGVLNRIHEHISSLNSMQVDLYVTNPDYEEVKVKLGAKFYKGLDENLYKKKLEEDIMKFLSPWAFERAREITFGVSLHRSTLIHYIEKLDYVDYVENVEVFKEDVLQPRICAPSNPRSILVSAKSHVVRIAVDSCANNTDRKVTEEKCQL